MGGLDSPPATFFAVAEAYIEVRLRPRGRGDELIGKKSRDKLVRLDGIERAEVLAALSS